MNHKLAQLRSEIAQEFSEIEYQVRGSLALFLFEQDRALKTYTKQFERRKLGFELNPAVLQNPDVKLMDSELNVSEELNLSKCIERLGEAASKNAFVRTKRLSELLKEIEEAAKKRNVLTHSIWREVDGKVLFQNFPDYCKQKYFWIDKYENQWSPGGIEKWSKQRLMGFLVHVRNLNNKLDEIFRL